MKKRQKPAYAYEGAKGDPLTMRLLKDRSVVKDFHGVDWHKRTKVFPIFMVFKDPTDFPGKYVVRSIKTIIDQSGYDLLARIEIRDRITGRVYR